MSERDWSKEGRSGAKKFMLVALLKIVQNMTRNRSSYLTITLYGIIIGLGTSVVSFFAK